MFDVITNSKSESMAWSNVSTNDVSWVTNGAVKTNVPCKTGATSDPVVGCHISKISLSKLRSAINFSKSTAHRTCSP